MIRLKPILENWDLHNNTELPDEVNNDYTNRVNSISEYLLGEIMPCSITIFGNNDTKKIVPKGSKITKSVIRAMAKYGYEIENCPIGKQIAAKINSVKNVKEGNDMASMDIGHSSPSAPPHIGEGLNPIDALNLTGDDFRKIIELSRPLPNVWTHLLASQNNPNKFNDNLNVAYEYLTKIEAAVGSLRSKIDPGLK